MTFGEKILELRKNRGWSQKQLEYKSGIPRGTIASIERDRSLPKTDILLKLARAFDRPVEELYEAAGYDTGAKIERHIETHEEIMERLRLAQPESVPVYDDFRGHWGQVSEEPLDYIYRARSGAPKRNLEAFIVHGHCMEPDIKDGNIVVVDRDLPGESGDVVMCLANNELVVGKLDIKENETWIVNNEAKVKIENCQASAVVIEVIKKLK